MTRIRDVTSLSEALDESLEDFDDFEGAGNEVFDFASARIDDLFPGLENNRFQSERAESLWQFSGCRQITSETLESCSSPGCIGVFDESNRRALVRGRSPDRRIRRGAVRFVDSDGVGPPNRHETGLHAFAN